MFILKLWAQALISDGYYYSSFALFTILGSLFVALSLFLYFRNSLSKSDRTISAFHVLFGCSNKIYNQLKLPFILLTIYLVMTMILTFCQREEVMLLWAYHVKSTLFIYYPVFFVWGASFLFELAFKRTREQRKDMEEILVAKDYEPWGCLSWWSAASTRFNKKRKWIESVYQELMSNHIFLIDQPKLSISSPSANKSSYENYMCEHLQHHTTVRMLCSDLASVPDREKPLSNGNLIYSYDENVNGKDIVSFLKRKNAIPVDVIWDNKGCLWHQITAASNDDKMECILRQFTSYSNVLADNGIIIIDAYPKRPFLIWLNRTLVRGYGFNLWGYAERSTETLIENHVEANKQLSEMFERSYLGTGIYRIAIYRKRKSVTI